MLFLLEFSLEGAERGGPGPGVLADPSVVDQLDGDRVQEVELLATTSPGDHQVRLLEHAQVLHDAETGHRQALLELGERLAVLFEEPIEQLPSGGISECPEHLIHDQDYM
jgi:hypothetical protein